MPSLMEMFSPWCDCGMIHTGGLLEPYVAMSLYRVEQFYSAQCNKGFSSELFDDLASDNLYSQAAVDNDIKTRGFCADLITQLEGECR